MTSSAVTTLLAPPVTSFTVTTLPRGRWWRVSRCRCIRLSDRGNPTKFVTAQLITAPLITA